MVQGRIIWMSCLVSSWTGWAYISEWRQLASGHQKTGEGAYDSSETLVEKAVSCRSYCTLTVSSWIWGETDHRPSVLHLLQLKVHLGAEEPTIAKQYILNHWPSLLRKPQEV